MNTRSTPASTCRAGMEEAVQWIRVLVASGIPLMVLSPIKLFSNSEFTKGSMGVRCRG